MADSSDFEVTYTATRLRSLHCPELDRSQERILEMHLEGGEEHVVNILGTFRADKDVPEQFETLEHVQKVVWSFVEGGLLDLLYRKDESHRLTNRPEQAGSWWCR